MSSAPPIDLRTADALSDEISKKLSDNISGWTRANDPASEALIGIVARLGEIVIDRLNRAPDLSLIHI